MSFDDNPPPPKKGAAMSIASMLGLIAWLFVSLIALGSFAYGSAVGYRRGVESGRGEPGASAARRT
jgi:hypothetical protein